MKPNFHDILFEILDIIGYPNNKEKFVREFEELNKFETIAIILETLPQDMQEKLKAGGNEQIEIEKYVSKEVYLKEFEKVSAGALRKFVNAISPILALKQKQQIDNLMPVKIAL